MDGPSLWLLDLHDELLAAVLSFATAETLARMRAVSKVCHRVHVPAAEPLNLARRKLPLPEPHKRGDEPWLHRLHFLDLLDERERCTMAAGRFHTACIRPDDGAPYSWGGQDLYQASSGASNDGALGPETSQRRLYHLGQGQARGPCVSVPTPMVGLDDVEIVEVAAGASHTLLLGACGGVWSCGDGSFGKLGHGDTAHHATPRRIESLAHVKAVQVAAGESHSLVLSAAGEVYSFGANGGGCLGHGDEGALMEGPSVPAKIMALAHTRIVQVSAGGVHSLAVGEEGELYSWGAGNFGQLGLGENHTANMATPVRVALPSGVRIRQASAGRSHSLAVATDGALYSFGWGYGGRLGHGDQKTRWVLTLVEALADTPVRSAAAGGLYSVVVTEAAEVLTFGSNGYGQLGLGEEDDEDRLVPTAVEALAGKEVAEVAAGDNHTVARLADDEVWAFGLNNCGQLGIGEADGCAEPTKVVGLHKAGQP